MPEEITGIQLPLPLHLGSVNCYLIRSDAGFVLIDTAGSNARADLERRLERAGCRPGTLKLIVITHGDFDHTGNAAYLRKKLGAPIAMHSDDAGMAERGDMFLNRGKINPLIKRVSPLIFRFPQEDRFTPDVAVGEGDDLSPYGFDARILSIPGHSKGSIGILTAGGDLFCGDLLENTSKPTLGGIIADAKAAQASVERLRSLGIRMVYPGHGRPFPMAQLI